MPAIAWRHLLSSGRLLVLLPCLATIGIGMVPWKKRDRRQVRALPRWYLAMVVVASSFVFPSASWGREEMGPFVDRPAIPIDDGQSETVRLHVFLVASLVTFCSLVVVALVQGARADSDGEPVSVRSGSASSRGLSIAGQERGGGPKTAIVTTSAAWLRRAERVAALHQFGDRPESDAPRFPSSERRGGGVVLRRASAGSGGGSDSMLLAPCGNYANLLKLRVDFRAQCD
ncbi:MAG: hypothetical protein V2A73_12175 [Pseudomonadota bacterium]